MSALVKLEACPSWCVVDHDRDATFSSNVHYGPLTTVEASLVDKRASVRVQPTAACATEDYPNQWEPVHIWMAAPADTQLLPVEARALARVLLAAADLAETAGQRHRFTVGARVLLDEDGTPLRCVVAEHRGHSKVSGDPAYLVRAGARTIECVEDELEAAAVTR